MNCARVSKHFPDYLVANPDDTLKIEIDRHLNDCIDCRDEYATLRQTWEQLEELPDFEPGSAVRVRFQEMLHAFEAGQRMATKQRWLDRVNQALGRFWFKQPSLQVGFAIAMLCIGLFLGSRDKPMTGGSTQDLGELRQEVHNLSKLVTLSLLRQPSSSERLRGVSYSSMVEHPDEETLGALLNTLNYDQTPNVRLAAVDALATFYEHDVVRLGLIESLTKQTSPLIQIALINLFVELQEKESLEALKFLRGNEMFNKTVRRRAAWAIEQLQ